jgi:glycosyltransferase involved in cell wall biosynthesis
MRVTPPVTPRRVLLVVDWMGAGGMERQIVELLKGLRRDGAFQVALAVLDSGGVLESEAGALAEVLLPVRRRSRFDLLTPLVGLTQHIRLARPGLVHTFGWMSGLVGLLAGRAARVGVINGGIRSALPRLGKREQIIRVCAGASDAIVANSHAGLRAFGMVGHRRARVIHNGIDMTRFAHLNPQISGDPVLGMVANFSQYKDHATAIRALPLIRGTVPGARLVLVGRDAGTLDEARRTVAEYGLEQAVTIHTSITRPEPLVAAWQVGVLTSPQGEGISNALLEYMALGKPVVATDCGGNPEVVRHGETGYLVPDGSPEALADRVVTLLKDKQLAHTMGAAGRKHVAKAFSFDRMVAEYQTLYDELLREAPGG